MRQRDAMAVPQAFHATFLAPHFSSRHQLPVRPALNAQPFTLQKCISIIRQKDTAYNETKGEDP